MEVEQLRTSATMSSFEELEPLRSCGEGKDTVG